MPRRNSHVWKGTLILAATVLLLGGILLVRYHFLEPVRDAKTHCLPERQEGQTVVFIDKTDLWNDHGAGRLVGVITDGDLRRQQLARGALLDRRAGDCMTQNPKRIGADELAARALALMEGVITSLVITDASGRPAGVIHIHDVLRAKIV